MNIVELIKSVKPTISDSTLKAYTTNIGKLHRAITGKSEIQDLNFLKQKDKVDEYLSKFSKGTKTNYYGVILTLLKTKDEELYKQYEKDKIANNFANKQKVMSDTNKDKLIDMKVYDDMLSKIKKAGLTQDYIMLRMLQLYPYRNEIGSLKIVPLKQFKKIKDKNDNYLVVGSKKLFVNRNNYKTSKIYGSITNDITDKKFKKELMAYIKSLDGRTELFLNKLTGKSMTPAETSNRLSYITQKYSDLKLSTSSIFKIVLSNFKGNDMKEYTDFLVEMGRIRGTDPKTLIDYYIHKKKDSKVDEA